MACDPKVVMTIEIGENGKVIGVNAGEGKKLETFKEGCDDSNGMPVGTIFDIDPMTVFRAKNSPNCWYLYAGRWYKVC